MVLEVAVEVCLSQPRTKARIRHIKWVKKKLELTGKGRCGCRPKQERGGGSRRPVPKGLGKRKQYRNRKRGQRAKTNGDRE